MLITFGQIYGMPENCTDVTVMTSDQIKQCEPKCIYFESAYCWSLNSMPLFSCQSDFPLHPITFQFPWNLLVNIEARQIMWFIVILASGEIIGGKKMLTYGKMWKWSQYGPMAHCSSMTCKLNGINTVQTDQFCSLVSQSMNTWLWMSGGYKRECVAFASECLQAAKQSCYVWVY